MSQSSSPTPLAAGPFGIEPGALTRRGALKSALFAAGASLAATAAAQTPAKPAPDDRRGSPKKFNVKKSINLWAFRSSEPSSGDWIWYRSAEGGGFGLGRVVAGPGKSVEWFAEDLIVDGAPLGWRPFFGRAYFCHQGAMRQRRS